MTVSLENASITFPLSPIGAALLRAAAASIDAATSGNIQIVKTETPTRPVVGASAETPAAKKRGRPPKAAKPVEEDISEAELDDTEGQDDSDDLDFGDDLGDNESESESDYEQPAPKKKSAPKAAAAKAISLEKDIIPACQADRAKAQKLLTTKYKLKSVRDLPAEKFEEFLKAMRA